MSKKEINPKKTRYLWSWSHYFEILKEDNK